MQQLDLIDIDNSSLYGSVKSGRTHSSRVFSMTDKLAARKCAEDKATKAKLAFGKYKV